MSTFDAEWRNGHYTPSNRQINISPYGQTYTHSPSPKNRKNHKLRLGIVIVLAILALAGGTTAIMQFHSNQQTNAATTQTTDFDTALANAKKLNGLTVTTTKQTKAVKNSAEAQALIDAETQKLTQAIATQTANNKTYENRSKDPNYIFHKLTDQNKADGYTPEILWKFLNDNGITNVKDLYPIELPNIYETKVAPITNATRITSTRQKDLLNWGLEAGAIIYNIRQGDYYIFPNALKDNNNKSVDIKFTIKNFTVYEDALQPMMVRDTMGFSIGGGVSSVTWDISFLYHDTQQPFTANFIWLNHDLDGGGWGLLKHWGGDFSWPAVTGAHGQAFKSPNTAQFTPSKSAVKAIPYQGSTIYAGSLLTEGGEIYNIDPPHVQGQVLSLLKNKNSFEYTFYSDVSMDLTRSSKLGDADYSQLVDNGVTLPATPLSQATIDAWAARNRQAVANNELFYRTASGWDADYDHLVDSWAYVGFAGDMLNMQLPNLTTSSVSVTEYTFTQKTTVNYVDITTNKTLTSTTATGNPNATFTCKDDTKVTNYINTGYDFVSTNCPTTPKFDSNLDSDQSYIVYLTPHIEEIPHDNPKEGGTPTDRPKVKYPDGVDEADLIKEVTRTIYYVYHDGRTASEPVVQKTILTRDAVFNYVTKEVEYSDWTVAKLDSVKSPTIAGHTVDINNVDGIDISIKDEPENVTVTYTPEQLTVANPKTKDTSNLPLILAISIPATSAMFASLFFFLRRR
ncbi:hypothetical protein IKF15_03145 [Candidatus Saccharibacteria bacterium]|nr:hypothetical protein [Candidatus Saccharibacteria bacterium]